MNEMRINWNKLTDYLVSRGVSSTICGITRLDGFMSMCLNGEINMEEIDGKSLGVLIAGEVIASELEVIAERMESG